MHAFIVNVLWSINIFKPRVCVHRFSLTGKSHFTVCNFKIYFTFMYNALKKTFIILHKPTVWCFNRFLCCVLRAKEKWEKYWEWFKTKISFIVRAKYVYRRCDTLLLCPGMSRLSLFLPWRLLCTFQILLPLGRKISETSLLGVFIGSPKFLAISRHHNYVTARVINTFRAPIIFRDYSWAKDATRVPWTTPTLIEND